MNPPEQPNYSLPRLFSDQPPRRGEELQFEFDGLAKTLAQLALNKDNPTPFTVVVRGGWGRGKTTLLRRAQYMMETPSEVTGVANLRTVKTLWFNAWKYPSEETVLAGLLGQLLDKFHTGKIRDQLKILVEGYKGSIFAKILYLVAPEVVREFVDVGGLKNRFSEVEKQRAFHDTFRELFVRLSAILLAGKLVARDTGHFSEEDFWTEQRRRDLTLAIFLDDLDRCRGERVREVLEAINLFLDLPGVCFFLGVDWHRLVANLPEAVKKEGDQYLEKIVQVALELPEVREDDARSFIGKLIEGTFLAKVIPSKKGADETLALAEALESLHPRHIKRFLNDLSLALAVLDNTGKLDTSVDRRFPDKVPPAAVFVWHLLGEVLPADKWREVRRSKGDAELFVQQAKKALERGKSPKEAAQGEVGEEGPADPRQEWEAKIGASLLPRHIEQLVQVIEAGTMDILVHVATPVETSLDGHDRAARSGLLHLDSGDWVELEAKEPFTMGSDDSDRKNEKPAHPVALSPYWIGRYPVTNEDYSLYVQEVDKKPPEHWEDGRPPAGKERHPVVEVSLQDAEAYCTWLTRKLGKKGFEGTARLPTEAEWEFAARGRAGREFPWGEAEPNQERANFGNNVGDTTPVGSYSEGATLEGIHDLAGNVWEWCQDWYAGGYEANPSEIANNPQGPSTGSSRVVCGGAFYSYSGALRGASRDNVAPEDRSVDLGFRVVFVSR